METEIVQNAVFLPPSSDHTSQNSINTDNRCSNLHYENRFRTLHKYQNKRYLVGIIGQLSFKSKSYEKKNHTK